MTRRHMIVRGSVFSLAALAIMTIGTIGPPTSSHAKPPTAPSARDELRTKIATLRGEIGLLRLESDADRANLFEYLKTSAEDRQQLKASFIKTYARASDAALATIFDDPFGEGDHDQAQFEALKKKYHAIVANGEQPSREKAIKDLIDGVFDVEAKLQDRELNRRKTAYKDRLIQMAEKELLLEDAMKRYREAE